MSSTISWENISPFTQWYARDLVQTFVVQSHNFTCYVIPWLFANHHQAAENDVWTFRVQDERWVSMHVLNIKCIFFVYASICMWYYRLGYKHVDLTFQIWHCKRDPEVKVPGLASECKGSLPWKRVPTARVSHTIRLENG